MKPLRARIIVIPLFSLLLATLSLSGQTAGASMDSVRSTEGEPAMIRKKGDQEIWMYEDGRKFTFQNGVVTTVADGSTGEGVILPRVEDAEEVGASSETSAAGVAEAATPQVRAESAVTVVPSPPVPTSAGAGSGAVEVVEEELEWSIAVAMLGSILLWLVCEIWFLVRAFQKGILWGFGCMFVPVVPLFFATKYWSEVKLPFILTFLSAGLMLLVSKAA